MSTIDYFDCMCPMCDVVVPPGTQHTCFGAPAQTTGNTCSICGQAYGLGQVHGRGFCDQARPQQITERYIGVTPEQVRQIVREEIERALERQRER